MLSVPRGLMKRFSGGFLISASLSVTDLVCLIKKLIFTGITWRVCKNLSENDNESYCLSYDVTLTSFQNVPCYMPTFYVSHFSSAQIAIGHNNSLLISSFRPKIGLKYLCAVFMHFSWNKNVAMAARKGLSIG